MQKLNPLPLNKIQSKIIKGLTDEGIYITSIEELFPGSDYLIKLQEYANELKDNSSQNKTKKYWLDMWDVKAFKMDLSNPFLQFALEEKVIAVANAYQKMYSKLHSIGLSETIPVKKGAAASQSQQWHRDPGNKKFVKVFIYINDVDEGAGPFIYLKKSQPGGKWYKIFPQLNPYSEKSGRISDEDIRSHSNEEDIVHCIGKAGTVVFADTVGFHKGSYSVTDSRFASIITYISENASDPKKRMHLRYPDEFEKSITQKCEAVKFAAKPS